MSFRLNFIKCSGRRLRRTLWHFFHEFHQDLLMLYSPNFGTIILLPKCEEAVKIQQFRTICLLNVSFKIFTKILTNRLSLVAQKVIQPTQMACIPSTNIMEGVIVLHETIHELHRKKQNGMVFKIDFEEAYDKVKWSFVR
jgi:hypothetical protein